MMIITSELLRMLFFGETFIVGTPGGEGGLGGGGVGPSKNLATWGYKIFC